MVIVWHGPDARASVLFPIFLFCAEVFIQFRWRTSMPCPHCGFDPVVYLQTPEEAARRVKAHLEKRQQDPMVLLSAKAKLDLPVIKKSKLQELQSHESRQPRLVNRRV